MYGIITLYDVPFQKLPIFYGSYLEVLLPRICRNKSGLGYFLFARHYLGNRFFFLFLRVMRCFSSPGWLHNYSWWQDFILPCCPIQKCTDQVLFADPRAFSQLTTSFFAYRSLGILCSPFVTSSCESFDIIHLPFSDNVQHRSIFVIVVPNSIIITDYLFFFTSILLSQYFNERIPENIPGILSLSELLAASMPTKALPYLHYGGRTPKLLFVKRQAKERLLQNFAPKRRCSSHTFRYGYLVTT